MDYNHEEVRARVMVSRCGGLISVFLISSLSNVWFLWLSIILLVLYWPQSLFMVRLWNKIGFFGLWASGSHCLWLKHVKDYVDAQGYWQYYLFLGSAWDDTSDYMTSLSHRGGDGEDLIPSMFRTKAACQWIMVDGVNLLLDSRDRYVWARADRHVRLRLSCITYLNKILCQSYGDYQIKGHSSGVNFLRGLRFIMAKKMRYFVLLGYWVMLFLFTGLYKIVHYKRFLHTCFSSLKRLFQNFF